MTTATEVANFLRRLAKRVKGSKRQYNAAIEIVESFRTREDALTAELQNTRSELVNTRNYVEEMKAQTASASENTRAVVGRLAPSGGTCGALQITGMHAEKVVGIIVADALIKHGFVEPMKAGIVADAYSESFLEHVRQYTAIANRMLPHTARESGND